jgi:hypothetical protein
MDVSNKKMCKIKMVMMVTTHGIGNETKLENV